MSVFVSLGLTVSHRFESVPDRDSSVLDYHRFAAGLSEFGILFIRPDPQIWYVYRNR